MQRNELDIIRLKKQRHQNNWMPSCLVNLVAGRLLLATSHIFGVVPKGGGLPVPHQCESQRPHPSRLVAPAPVVNGVSIPLRVERESKAGGETDLI